ncbi:Uncharacterised protein [Sphingobacterium multivorum]|uniref:Tetratricopeptide repeat protein n=2 Tax=Sphingobacteriaceae TaxID=84566 RepID=A0A654BM48_SPHMU|nr:Uncharacterised protein [Sphingobacterium multivorum]VXC81677.1 conserved hypothetical protein [Sphingobacterium multivorum]
MVVHFSNMLSLFRSFKNPVTFKVIVKAGYECYVLENFMNSVNKYVLQALDNYPMYLEETMESLSYAPSYDESNTMALCLMGRVHAEQLLDYEQAKRYFQEALVHNVQALEVYPYFIQTLIDMGEYEAAKKTIKFALTLPAMPLTGIWIKKALLFEKMRKYKKALKALKKAKLENVDLDFSSSLKAIEDRIKGKQEIKNGNEKENKKERKNSRK